MESRTAIVIPELTCLLIANITRFAKEPPMQLIPAPPHPKR